MSLSKEKKENLDNLIVNLAMRLSDVNYVNNSLESNMKGTNVASVGISYPSLCILFSELQLNFKEYNFDIYAHNYLEIINDYLGKNKISEISLFDGLCGIGFAAKCMSIDGKRYARFINNLNEHIIDIANTAVYKYKNTFFNEFSYDVMYGASGIANYLLNFNKEREARNVLLKLIQYLVDISQISNDRLPKFLIQANDSTLLSMEKPSQLRYVNLGIAHGIPGILLILSKLYEVGIRIMNQLETIKYLSEYISDCVKILDNEVFWESQKFIGFKEEEIIPARDAWCYGTPGVCYSLLVASNILNDNNMRLLAIKGMKSALQRLHEAISPTFCHGYAGLCRLAGKFYEHTNDKFFQDVNIKLLYLILDMYNEEYPFGFKDVEIENGQIVNRNEIGLLNGTSGILLTILSCYRPIKTKWDSIFLI